MDFLMLMATTGSGINCTDPAVSSVMTLVGWVVWVIKVIVPILLVVMGMVDMAKAVTEKSEDKIKDAQKKLITKAIAAVIVFLIPTLVTLIMNVIGAKDWKPCLKCVTNPGGTREVEVDGSTVNINCNIVLD